MQEQKVYRFLVKILKYSIVVFSLFLVLIFSLLVVITKMYNEELKEMAFNQINAKLNTQFSANHIDVSVIDQFPNISITFSDVFIEDPNSKKDTLLYSDKLYLNFNAIDLIKRNYNINSIILSKGIIKINIDKNGNENYFILKEDDEFENNQFRFVLKEVSAENFNVVYDNFLSRQSYEFFNQKIVFSGDFSEKQFLMNMQTKMTVKAFEAQGLNYIKNKPMELNLDLLVNNDSSIVSINHGNLSVADMSFSVVGDYHTNGSENINVLIHGDNIQLSQVFSIFPIDYLSVLDKYRSRGELEFNATVIGSVKGRKPLSFVSTFNVVDGSFTALNSNVTLSRLNLNGGFDNNKGKLELFHFSGSIGKELINGSMSIEQFKNPLFKCEIQGELDFDKLSKFTQNSEFDISGNGKIFLDTEIKFDKGETSIQKISGELKSQNTSIGINDLSLYFSDLAILTSKNNLICKKLIGTIDKSDFNGNILLHDWITSLFGFKNEIKAELNVDVDKLDLSSLIDNLNLSTDSNSNKWEYKLASTVNVKEFSYKKFRAKNISSEWGVDRGIIYCKKINFNGQGGDYHLTGSFKNNNNLKLSGNIDKIKVEKLFESFSNFNQDFLTNKQIKGNSNLVFNMEMPLLRNNEFDFSNCNLTSEVSFKGELINHPFLKELLEYFNNNPITTSIVDYNFFSKKIQKVVFEEITTDVSIINGKVFFPKTQINNNVLNMNISGWQSFNDSIDYHLNFNWRELRRKSLKESDFGEIEDDGLGKQVFLNIKGTIEDPVYKLDQSQKKQSRKVKVNEEKAQIKSILKGEGVPESDSVGSKPKFEVSWEEEDTSSFPVEDSIPEENLQRKKKDSTKVNKWLKKLGVEEKKKEKPIFEIEN